jgi:hypothetical protein
MLRESFDDEGTMEPGSETVLQKTALQLKASTVGRKWERVALSEWSWKLVIQ